MAIGAKWAQAALALTGGALLSACLAPQPTLKPHSRPAGLVKPAPPRASADAPSDKRRDLEAYYAKVQSNYLIKGLYRTDGGGPDTRFTAADLVRNFSQIAFRDEYDFSPTSPDGSGFNRLRRWARPIHVKTTFGASISPEQRQQDSQDITAFTARLARVTGHPIGPAGGNRPNFHVFVMSQDDKSEMVSRARRLFPQASEKTFTNLRSLRKSAHCVAFTWADANNPALYESALILIRAEHPRLGRRACIHEEMAQGLGLRKDSGAARPSIFNDDEEFALLTTHDEMLLKMLYDRRLRPGMTFDEARPFAMEIASELVGNASLF